MNILIVEDDRFKLDAIQRLVERFSVTPQIASAASLHEALLALDVERFDFVILDMAIPSHTGGPGVVDTYSQPVGGLDVLLFLASNERAERVVVLTQYPTVEYNRRHVPLKELLGVLAADGIANVKGAIFFDGEDWKASLSSALQEMSR